MTDNEKLMDLLCRALEDGCERYCNHPYCHNVKRAAEKLLANGITFSAAVPGHENQYNIAEMSYKNGYEKGLEDGKRQHAKYGRWIIKSRGHGSNAMQWAECSECCVCGSPQWKVCPVCETKMNPVQFPVNDFDPDDFMGEYEEEND